MKIRHKDMPQPRTFECFGLVFHGFGWPEVEERLNDAVRYGSPLWLVTANPEILLEAKRNPRYWDSLRQAKLRLVDGVGLQLVGLLKGASVSRFSGVDLAEALLRRAEKEDWTVAFVGGDHGVADRAAWAMREKYPRLRIVAEHGGHVTPEGYGDAEHEVSRQRLLKANPDVLLLAWSHPKPDIWLSKYAVDFPNLKAACGVGGTLDYWSGNAVRAPRVFQVLGLEWLWRGFREPKRWRRIANAVFVFPWRMLQEEWVRVENDR